MEVVHVRSVDYWKYIPNAVRDVFDMDTSEASVYINKSTRVWSVLNSINTPEYNYKVDI